MKLNEEQLADLMGLAVTRTEKAFHSVTQLMDSNPQIYALGIVLIVRMIEGASEMLQQSIEQEGGKRPTECEALAHVVAHVLEGVGFQCELKPPSQTQSVKK